MARPRGLTVGGRFPGQSEVVLRASRGDHDAFAVLARAAADRLAAAARLIMRDPEQAQDAVQEALIRAWRDLPRLRDPDRFDAWIHRLTVNACLDLMRRRRRRVIEVEVAPIEPAAESDVSSRLADRDILDAGLRRLEPELRAIVTMRYFLDMEVPDIADTLGIPLGTAKSRLHRALAELRVVVDPEPVVTSATEGSIR